MKYSAWLGTCLAVLLGWGMLYAQVQTEFSTDYKIGAKDLLDISVVGVPELNTTVRVSENGTISLPHLGEIDVEGLTKTELEERLRQRLKETILQDPQVTIFIREYQSKRVSVIGAVQNPGSYELLGRQTLLQIITLAGGLTADADEEIIVIREVEDGTKTTLRISREELMTQGQARLDIPLQPNDIINIPPQEMVKVFVMGQVRNPGALNVKKSKLPTLLQAIAEAGGFSERASKGGVTIKRYDEDGNEQIIKVNVKDIQKGKKSDIQLQENDVVIVPESIF